MTLLPVVDEQCSLSLPANSLWLVAPLVAWSCTLCIQRASAAFGRPSDARSSVPTCRGRAAVSIRPLFDRAQNMLQYAGEGKELYPSDVVKECLFPFVHQRFEFLDPDNQFLTFSLHPDLKLRLNCAENIFGFNVLHSDVLCNNQFCGSLLVLNCACAAFGSVATQQEGCGFDPQAQRHQNWSSIPYVRNHNRLALKVFDLTAPQLAAGFLLRLLS